MSKRFALAGLAALSCAASAGERFPSDAELGAAYCIATLQRDLEMRKRADATLGSLLKQPDDPFAPSRLKVEERLLEMRQRQSQTEAALGRLERYLVPRLPELEAFPIMAARKRAEEGQADAAQLEKCRHPTWLPY